jgi:hypothetical protein
VLSADRGKTKQVAVKRNRLLVKLSRNSFLLTFETCLVKELGQLINFKKERTNREVVVFKDDDDRGRVGSPEPEPFLRATAQDEAHERRPLRLGFHENRPKAVCKFSPQFSSSTKNFLLVVLVCERESI